MISWIQKYFQHHFRTVFVILLGVIIVAFVFTIGASPGIGGADRQIAERRFLNYNLNLPQDQQRLFGDAQLSASLQFGAFGGFPPEQIQGYAFQRGAALHLADEWQIPGATDAELVEAVKRMRTFAGQDGQFDAKAYATFLDNLKTNPRGMSEGDVKRVLSDDVRVEKVNKLLAGPGYVLPGDIKSQLTRADTMWTLATASADYASFKVDLKPTDAELTKFFEENAFRYEIPPRIVVSAIDFPATTHLAGVNVTEPEVRAFYDANPARFPKPAAPTPAPTPALPTDPSADYALVRTQVEAALKLERAQRAAVKAASDLRLALFEAKIPQGAALESFLGTRKLALKPIPPFTRAAPPAELGGSPDAAEEAFKLNAERFVSDAIPTPTGAAVLVWKELQPARKPLFTEVREKVSTDYLENEKRKRFVELGRTMKSQLEARLKAGDTFEKAAEAVSGSAGVKLEAKTLPAFSPRTRPQDIDFSVLGTLERLEKGMVSDMVVDTNNGLFVYAIEKKAPDLTEANPRYVETRDQLASVAGRIASSSVLSELVENEHKKWAPKAPTP